MAHLTVINMNEGKTEIFLNFHLEDNEEIEDHLTEIGFNLNEISWGLVNSIEIT